MRGEPTLWYILAIGSINKTIDNTMNAMLFWPGCQKHKYSCGRLIISGSRGSPPFEPLLIIGVIILLAGWQAEPEMQIWNIMFRLPAENLSRILARFS